MRCAWIIVVGLAPVLLTGCETTRSLARKERLPNSSLGAGKMTPGPLGVDSVLRSDSETSNRPETDSLADTTPIPTAVPASARANVEQAAAHEMTSLTDSRGTGNPPAQGASATRAVAHQVADPVNSAERMRAIAHRLKQSSPERLDDFMKEVRQGATQGNMDSVLASWEVSLEFLDDSPSAQTTTEHRSNSLSAALKKNRSDRAITDPSTTTANLSADSDRQEERQARVMSVAASIPADDDEQPPALQQPIAPSQGLRRLPYRGEDSPSPEPRSRSKSAHGVDFASWAEYAEEQSTDKKGDPARWKVYGKLLHAMAGNTDRALEPIEGLDPADRRFWRGYVYALDRYFDDGIAKPEHRATEAAVALSESIDALAEKADLGISEPVFCRAVHSFGNYEEFDQANFHAGDGVVVYWECKHFTSVETSEGYRTKMKAEFEILDSLGNRRHQFEQKFKDDVCRGRRHDYFNVVVFEWPRDLPPGEYTLKVTVTDLASDKVAEKQRRFQIAK